MSQQGLRQAAFRAESGTTGTYNEDMYAAISAYDGVTINEKIINWLQSALSSSSTNINDLQAEAAVFLGATSWSAIGSNISTLFAAAGFAILDENGISYNVPLQVLDETGASYTVSSIVLDENGNPYSPI